jgi:replicative DNA helicase
VDAWSVGTRPVFELTTQSGRAIRATAGHRFLTVAGWKKLSELEVDDSIAVPRRHAPPARPKSDERIIVMARSTYARLAEKLDDVHLAKLAFSDVLWDRIESIVPQGEKEVFDITVDDLHNFCVDGVVTHNSGAIEQEADMVAFLYRDAYYNPESAPEPDLTEFIIAKQRNGPTGMIKLRFIKEHTLFVPYGDSSRFSGP